MQENGRSVVSAAKSARETLDGGGGIVRLAPAWVPRAFCTPGRRIKLHPHDYFPFGKERGGIDERWFSSAIRAENGPGTGPFEGLSMVVTSDEELIPFDEFVGDLRQGLLGERLWQEWGRWPMYSKFFDNLAPLPFHIHQRDEHAALVGKPGKPEAYYFAPQVNNYGGWLPETYFGLHPETTREQLLAKIEDYLRGGDNRITELSRGYRLTVGTGWNVPAGVLHAPGSLCTYEPQADCDVFAMFESWSNNREVGDDLLWKDVPEDHRGDPDFLLEIVDWDENTDATFKKNHFMEPVETGSSRADGSTAYQDKWVVYRSPRFSAKELTVAPGERAVITDADAHGLICTQGTGIINGSELASPSMIRYGALTHDEYFVSHDAATSGIEYVNMSSSEPLVVLRHFGPGNAQLAQDRPADQ